MSVYRSVYARDHCVCAGRWRRHRRARRAEEQAVLDGIGTGEIAPIAFAQHRVISSVLLIDSAQLLRNFAAQSSLWSSLHTTMQTSPARSVAITAAESLLRLCCRCSYGSIGAALREALVQVAGVQLEVVCVCVVFSCLHCIVPHPPTEHLSGALASPRPDSLHSFAITFAVRC